MAHKVSFRTSSGKRITFTAGKGKRKRSRSRSRPTAAKKLHDELSEARAEGAIAGAKYGAHAVKQVSSASDREWYVSRLSKTARDFALRFDLANERLAYIDAFKKAACAALR